MGLEDRTRYDPGESEERIFARWLDSGRFQAETGYCPPNWTDLVDAMRQFG